MRGERPWPFTAAASRLALLAILISALVSAHALGADAAPSTSPSPLDGEIAAIQAKLDEARAEMARDAADRKSIDRVAVGATVMEVQERDRLWPRIVRGYEKHLEAYARLKDNRQSQEALDAEIKGWHGFDEKPPYSIDLKDNLRELIHSSNLAIKAIGTERNLAATSLSDARDNLPKAEASVRGLDEQIEREASAAALARLRWQRSMAALRARSYQVTISLGELQERLADEMLATENQRLAFLKRKLATVAGNTVFTAEMLTRKLELIDGRSEQVRGDLQKAMAAADAAVRDLADLQGRLRGLASSAAGTRPASTQPEIEDLRARVRLAQAQGETAAFQAECLRSYLDTLDTFRDLIKRRYAFLNTRDSKELEAAAARVNLGLGRLSLLMDMATAKQDAISALIRPQSQRVLTMAANAPLRDIEQQILDSYRQRDTAWRDRMSRIEGVQRFLLRCQDDLAELGQQIPLSQRLRDAWASFTDVVSSIWNFEIFSVEDAITVDGRSVVGKRSITVSKVVMALLALTLGLALCRRITGFFSRRILPRFKLEQSTRVLVERLLYMGLVTTLAIFALTYFRIPLTVFAFFGGALAIGIGFGAQNLINNFISGLILLVERPIRLGDIVEVDGQMGRVAAIGSRCSRVKLLNGIDMLIPNSSLLEHRVTNWTLSDRNLRCSIDVGVAYGSLPRKVSAIIARAVAEHPRVKPQPAPDVIFSDFGDNALMFRVLFWIELVDDLPPAIIESEVRHRIMDVLTEAGVEIPFPQRDIHLTSIQPVEVKLVRGIGQGQGQTSITSESLLR